MISLADDPYSFLYIQQFWDVIETKLRSCPLLPAGGTTTRYNHTTLVSYTCEESALC